MVLVEHDYEFDDGEDDCQEHGDFEAPALGALGGNVVEDSTVLSVTTKAGLVVQAPGLLEVGTLPDLFDIERGGQDSVILGV